MESTTAPRVKSCAHPYDRIVQSVDRHDTVSETRTVYSCHQKVSDQYFSAQYFAIVVQLLCKLPGHLYSWHQKEFREKKITRTVMNPVNPTAFTALIVVTYQVACKNLILPTETDICCRFGALLRRDVIGATMS